MEEYAANLLKLVLDRCQGEAFTEIRFVSGMSPAYVDKEGPHLLDVGYLTRELVGEVHQLCLLLADVKGPKSASSRSYAFSLRRLGRVLCTYQRRGNVASLVLVRETPPPKKDDEPLLRPKGRSSTRRS